jgi:hypothetical protein
MKPVKVWYLGILPLTRKQYFRIVVWGWLAILALLIVLELILPERVPPFRWPWDPLPPGRSTDWRSLFSHYFYTLVLGCLIGQVIDAAIMMRKFRAKEMEQSRRAMTEGLDA